MPKKCKGKRNALVVTVVAVLLGDIFAGGQNIPAQQKTWNAGDTKRTQMTESATQRMDLTDAFAVILQGATKKFIAGYAVDDSFLMWLAARYGDEKVVRIASAVLDGTEDPEVWYDITGSSIHVLWLMYCRDSGFQQYRLQNVYWKEAGEDGKIVLGFAGDINFVDDWYTMEYMNRQTNGIYDCFSEDLLSEMQNVDVMVMNNEFTYAESGSVEAVPGKAYTFRADPEDVELLSVFGTDAVTLANNHVYDYGEEGLLSTLDCLRKADIPYTGAGENRKEASKILSFVIGGRKIAIVSATQIERATKYTKEATETEPGVLKTLNPAAFLEVIREADATSDYVIVEVHWGTEGSLHEEKSQRLLAELYAEAGADAVIGGHPHRLQGCGFTDGVPVAYSLGNFWFSTGTLYTTLAKITITEDGAVTLSYVPCIQKGLVTSILTEQDDKDGFYHYLAAISDDIGMDADGNVYDKTAGDYPSQVIVYDSDTSKTKIRGTTDNDGYAIDIVGNRK